MLFFKRGTKEGESSKLLCKKVGGRRREAESLLSLFFPPRPPPRAPLILNPREKNSATMNLSSTASISRVAPLQVRNWRRAGGRENAKTSFRNLAISLGRRNSTEWKLRLRHSRSDRFLEHIALFWHRMARYQSILTSCADEKRKRCLKGLLRHGQSPSSSVPPAATATATTSRGVFCSSHRTPRWRPPCDPKRRAGLALSISLTASAAASRGDD